MRTILVINDYSVEAANAARMALSIGKKINADILIANTVNIGKKVSVKSFLQIAGSRNGAESDEREIGLIEKLESEKVLSNIYIPVINIIDASGFDESKLAELIIKNDIWLMVKGIKSEEPANSAASSINTQAVLNRVRCPLLLVPENFEKTDFERIVYMADLRYCKLYTVKYLVEMAKPYNARVQVAHISAKGLPDMEQNYANRFFTDTVSLNVNYDQLFFNNIKERDIQKSVDVMINGLHADLLVLVNHRFHFEEIFGRYIPAVLPKYITIPLLVFPC